MIVQTILNTGDMSRDNERWQAIVDSFMALGIDVNSLPRDEQTDLPILSLGEAREAYLNQLKLHHPEKHPQATDDEKRDFERQTVKIHQAWKNLDQILGIKALIQKERDERQRRSNETSEQDVAEPKSNRESAPNRNPEQQAVLLDLDQSISKAAWTERERQRLAGRQ